MKSKKIIFLEKTLRKMAKLVLKKYKPEIIGITGSVGKTTTKEMIGDVLGEFLAVRKNEKNYNNEIGIPLTIIGAQFSTSSVFQWIKVFLKWFSIIIFPIKYPKVLVLEMGADCPGDIKYFFKFIPISVGVLTNISDSHLEFFKNKEAIIREKSYMLNKLPNDGLGVYNYDNEDVRKAGEKIQSSVVSYGFEEGAKMRATDVLFGYQTVIDSKGKERQVLRGTSFKLNYKGKILPVRMDNCIGKPLVYAALAVFSVGEYFNLNLVEMAEVVKKFKPYPGRLNLLKGIKRSMIIDDTYNSSPESAKMALDLMDGIRASRKIVVLGDMLELGAEEEKGHRDIGRKVAEIEADCFVLVGERMKYAGDEFSKLGGADKMIEFASPEKAKMFVQELIKEGDLILIKGSQGMRMEKVVKEAIANPERKEELLVRQEEKWEKTPFQNP
jgi:UDP-N-acetylmuramoyl-tripeptide--D-alanyl-D-alanine ligase